MRIWNMRIKHAIQACESACCSLTSFEGYWCKIVLYCHLLSAYNRYILAQPIDIISRKEQEFGRPDASGA